MARQPPSAQHPRCRNPDSVIAEPPPSPAGWRSTSNVRANRSNMMQYIQYDNTYNKMQYIQYNATFTPYVMQFKWSCSGGCSGGCSISGQAKRPAVLRQANGLAHVAGATIQEINNNNRWVRRERERCSHGCEGRERDVHMRRRGAFMLKQAWVLIIQS